MSSDGRGYGDARVGSALHDLGVRPRRHPTRPTRTGPPRRVDELVDNWWTTCLDLGVT
jgi:hypothetical protein